MPKPNLRRKRLRAITIAVLAVAAIAVAGQPGLAAPGDGAGTLLTFGYNNYGQLGTPTNNGANTANPTPSPVVLPGQIGTVAQMAAGGQHSLFVTSSGQLYASGYNFYGQLGVAAGVGTGNPTPTPTLVTLPGQVGTVAHVAAGTSHSLAVTSSGQLYTFGNNYYGQLGNATNTTTTNPNPTPALVGLPGLVGAVTQIATGGNHSLAATSSGQLYGFGHNQFGQLGTVTNNGTSMPNPTPALVSLPAQGGTIADMAVGEYFSLVLTSSGQLYAFGTNYSGQHGTTTNIASPNANPTPTLVTMPGQIGSITRVAVGQDHSLVVTSSGQLYAFGSNYYGQLGNATNSGILTANPTPAIVGLPGQSGPVTQVAGGAGHSLAVTASGQLYGFGHNQIGQLGNATNNGIITANPTPSLASLPAGTTIATIARGSNSYHSLALVSNLAIATTTLAPAQVGTPYQAALLGAGGTSPRTWSATGVPAGLTFDVAGPTISGTPTAAGTFSLTATVTDVHGSSVARTFSLTIVPIGAPPPGGAATAPRLSALKQSASKWVLGSKLPRFVNTLTRAPKRNGLPIGTTFSFTSNQTTRTTLTFRRATEGRRVSGKCVAKTKSNTSKPRCTRLLAAGALRIQAKAGTNRLRFEGRINATKKLKPGTFNVLITATTAGKTSPPKTLRFTIATG